MGTLEGVGRIYQHTFIETYTKVGFAKLDTEKTAITAADLLNDRVLPFFEDHGIPLSRVLSDRGTEYCGAPDRHPYELYLAVEDLDHSRTKTKNPPSTASSMITRRTAPHQGRWWYGKAPMPTFLDSLALAKEKAFFLLPSSFFLFPFSFFLHT